MKHLDVVEQALTWLDAGKRVAVATVVKVEGSVYRREGAKMLITEDSHLYGTISGGCLEGDVAGHATQVLETGRPKTVRYDLTEDLMWGLGLGCGGNIEVHIEPAEAGWFRRLKEALEARRPVLAATLIKSPERGGDSRVEDPAHENSGQPHGGASHVLIADGEIVYGAMRDEAPEGQVLGQVLDETTRDLGSEFAGLRLYRVAGTEWTVFVEAVLPSRRLLVFGAGHDVLPVVRVAAESDLLPIVFDPRRTYLTEERFPAAARLVEGEPGETIPAWDVDERDSAVVMHHHFERDRAALRALLDADISFVGVLGPGKRTQTLLDRLRDEGYEPADEELARVHAPVGLDIGSEGSGQIAVSIIGEVLAHHAGRRGKALRERGGPIHPDRLRTPPFHHGASPSRAAM